METRPAEDAYKVKASDDLDYGPVDLPTLIEWVKDGRVLGATLIHCQSDHSWQRADSLPALREALAAARSARPASGESPGGEVSLEELRQFPRLAMLHDRQLEQVRRFGELAVAEPGACIIQKGDPGDALYLVLSGEVRVRLLVGLEDKTLSNILPGQFFGEMAIFNDAPRSADVVAVTATRLMRVTRQAFLLFIDEIPELASPILYNIARTMAERIVASNLRYQREKAAEFLWS